MKYILLLLCFGLTTVKGVSQIDNQNTSVRFESIENTEGETETLIDFPDIEAPSLTKPKKQGTDAPELGEEEPDIKFAEGDGLMDYKTDEQPKYFQKKDKPVLAAYLSDQNLGNVSTNGEFVNVMCRDHEYVDGDRIRIYVNGDVVRSDLSLVSSFIGLKLPLEQGINTVEFEALNQGTSGPNTAELHVYDDKGQLISAKEWNLGTGYKASFVIIKE
ncbi:hypothetical protein [Marixanthomonas spongiae]|uniref:Secreted protein n=1 Tax=Marixanthomonas spongiae TaxID=2174845 RepID=A0A2U0I3F2_9FLAO|nr:hypothetical protein [Marixanthomonas spongiae]PVW15647.1 hypothetical protein DDV96_05085 [Marixanthomonas spongiae]